MSARTERDKAWAHRFDAFIELVVRKNLGDIAHVIHADEEDDRTKAIDYNVQLDHPSVAARIRATDYRDITIRSWRPYKTRTEEEKLRDGYVSHYFYGWATSRDDAVCCAWTLFYVRPFMDSGLLNTAREISCRDGSARFKPVPAADLFTVPGCVVDSGGLEGSPRLFWPATTTSPSS